MSQIASAQRVALDSLEELRSTADLNLHLEGIGQLIGDLDLFVLALRDNVRNHNLQRARLALSQAELTAAEIRKTLAATDQAMVNVTS